MAPPTPEDCDILISSDKTLSGIICDRLTAASRRANSRDCSHMSAQHSSASKSHSIALRLGDQGACRAIETAKPSDDGNGRTLPVTLYELATNTP